MLEAQPNLPEIVYPDLPVSARRDEIAAAIRDHQVVIVAGETGSGKTTQLPKICLELGRTAIGHTQPRRIAARTIAERIAEELGTEIGDLVGYQVRFTDQSSKNTRIKLMTDGILLAELRRDRLLGRYDTIIIDEAHERSLNVDFLLGYLKQLLPKRPDLKVIITSATIDPESFAAHFADAKGIPAPIIEVSGRTYPVEIRYRPLVGDRTATDDDDFDDEDASPPKQPSVQSSVQPQRQRHARGLRHQARAAAAEQQADRDLFEGITQALQELEAEAPGDVLVFLPGEREIRDAEEAIRGSLTGRRRDDTEVLPLYGRLSARDQHRVFERGRAAGIRRRVVLATNVAETSLTVPGIAYVIDAGLARISRYSTRAKVQRLPIEAISQASANQRSGRSGRTRDGIAIRLYSEEDFERRPEFTDPEILRTNLASVLLQMVSLGLGAIDRFPFLTPPDPRGVKDGVELLRELGAIRAKPARDGSPQLTQIGRQLAQLPIEPRFARMLLAAQELGVGREVLIIVAGLTVQDLRERPLDHRQHADELHSRFRDPSSDFLSLVKLWDYLDEIGDELSSSAFRRRMKAEYLNFVRYREWQDLVRQLREVARPLGIETGKRTGGAADPDAVHKALLTGLLSHIGIRDELKRDYQGARNTRFRIFPGSGLAKAQPDGVMAAELVETSALFARTVAKIDPAWAEQLAGDLAKRRHAEPHWERKQGQAVASETVTLYGVPIVRNRRVGFATIDPAWSRDLFIRHALIEGDWTANYPFDRRNKQLRRQVEELEERTRQRGRIADSEELFEFFDERLPDEVVSQPSFDRWWREASKHQPDLLTLTRADLLGEDNDSGDEAEFPREWRQGDQRLKLRYKFDPHAHDDGVTALVPLPLLARLDPVGFDWGVPGMRAELVTALLKSLPKSTRRNFVPAADWARKLLAEVGEVRPDRGESVPGPLTETLHGHMQRAAGIRFDAAEFDLDRVPAHLRMRFRVVGDDGRELGAGEDLEALQLKLKRASEASLARATAVGLAVEEAAAPKRGRATAEPEAEAAGPVTEQRDLQGWPEVPTDEIPASFDLRRKHGVIRAYPSLRLADPAHPGTSKVDLVLATTADDQTREHPRAVATLLARAVPSPASYVQAHLTAAEKLSLAASPYRSTDALLADVLVALAVEALPDEPVRTRAEFEALRDRFNAGLVDAMFDTVKLVAQVLAAHRGAAVALKGGNALAHLGSLSDARAQLDALVFDGFVSRTGIERLGHLPRYLRAVTHRLERLGQSAALERAGMLELTTALQLYADAGGTFPTAPNDAEALVRARWLLEELRVSLFAQQLGTAESVSLKRIRTALAQ
ncbi:ATP-dependent RNA helicase HrpA [Gulosibacter macacae]|uniref:ATP-dependent RNA helicase HrpA n=1 Tax=Gulosibacter macacae TaxID=2488791 RepID=A0A3P3VV77_9MICO|nr:ATP-dependent RNA helicase HrpA [Gulosibacter macacae]RRJ86364.1 ATP-dependent RNA helicase HrpA [Gulosibacter macacae]